MSMLLSTLMIPILLKSQLIVINQIKGDLCYRVYCASQLGNSSYNFASIKQLIKPFFYVSVMDIEELQSEPFYLACKFFK